MSDIVTKRCTRCKQDKPITDFYAKYARCKACISQQEKAKRIRKRPIIPEGYKRCPRCEQILPATTEYFHSHKRKGSTNGLNTYCKTCHIQYEQARHEKPKVAPPPEITCYACRQTKPAINEFFARKKATINGLDTMCKDCRNAERKSNYYRNDEMRTKMQAKGRIYQKEHRDEKREYWKQWYQAHKEEQNAYRRAYGKLQHVRERRRAEVRNRRSLKRAAIGTHTKQDIQRQYERQKGRCYWCNQRLTQSDRTYHVDHVVPLSRGGSNSPDNLVISCHSCNESKNDKLPHEWPKGGRLL